MIKYKTTGLGSSVLNKRASDQVKYGLKPSLSGMRCSKCNYDTLIEFADSREVTFGAIQTIINACCPEFHQRIKDKLK